MISLEHLDGSIESTDKWKTYASAFNWCNPRAVRVGSDVFTIHIGEGLHRVDINGVIRVIPAQDVISTLRLALSCAVRRSNRFVGSVTPV